MTEVTIKDAGTRSRRSPRCWGESKVRMLILQGDLKSLKDGRSRRILPEWVDEYVQSRAERAAEEWPA